MNQTEMTEKSESMTTKIRKIISDLGPLGMIALVFSIFLFNGLIGDNFSNGLLGSTGSSGLAICEVEERQRNQITALFDPLEEVAVENIIISYDRITESSSTIFASSQPEQMVVRSVVVLHHGAVTEEYVMTRAISLILDVPFHQISLINTSDIIGGN